jgi:hypothetical protein
VASSRVARSHVAGPGVLSRDRLVVGLALRHGLPSGCRVVADRLVSPGSVGQAASLPAALESRYQRH